MTTDLHIKGGASAPLADTDDIRARWNEALRRYHLAQILFDANAAFGLGKVAERAYDDERSILGHEYGSLERAKATPDGAVRVDRAFRRMMDAEEKNNRDYHYPLWKTLRELARAPAPDIAAVRLKLDLIDKEEVWNDAELEEDCFDLIRADVARLREEAL